MAPMLQLATSLAWLFVVPTAALLYGFMPVSRRRATSFADNYGIAVTTTNGPILLTYLTRATRWRAVGGAVGWLIGGVFHLPGSFVFWGVAGYLVGALAAELKTAIRPLPEGPRRAALVVRRSSDYVSWGARWGPLLVIAALALQGSSYLVWPVIDSTHVELGRTILIAAAMVFVIAVLRMSQRFIVQRPQPLVSDELRMADDSIRSNALQTISGACLAMLCLLAADLMWRVNLDVDHPQPFSWISTALTLGMIAAVPVAWFGTRLRARRLRRKVSA